MSKVFNEANLAGIVLKNHLIRSATHEGLCDENGNPSEKLIKKYELLAKGEVGAIITGYIGVNQQGKSPLHNMNMINKEENVESFKILTERIHALGTPIIAQIAHCGGQTNSKTTGMKVVAPSKIIDYKVEAMSEQEVDDVINDFVMAVVNTKRAGFDGVQLHCAHGYLLSEFISPRMNRRQDKWGGTIENRCRIVVEIIKRARKEVGNYPILIKMNGFETSKKGLSIDEAVKTAVILEKAGCDAIEVSNGCTKEGMTTIRGNVPAEFFIEQNPKLKNMPKPIKKGISGLSKKIIPHPSPTALYNLDAAMAIKANVSIPVIVVGGISELSQIEDIIDNNKCDLVSMSRPFIIEPGIVKKMREGTSTKSKCIQCNYCLLSEDTTGLRCYYGKLPRQN